MSRASSRLGSRLVLIAAAILIVLVYPRLLVSFRRKVGYGLRVTLPRSYREKTQWRKIFDRNPQYVRLQDKLKTKEILRDLVPGQHFPAVLWSGSDPAAIPAAGLPDAFALKTNHGRGFNVLVGAAEPIGREQLIAQARQPAGGPRRRATD